MNNREFDKLTKKLTNKKTGLYDKEKIKNAPNELKNEHIIFLVCKREPIIVDLLNSDTDMDWLHSCGYLYDGKGKYFDFLCTMEQKISWNI